MSLFLYHSLLSVTFITVRPIPFIHQYSYPLTFITILLISWNSSIFSLFTGIRHHSHDSLIFITIFLIPDIFILHIHWLTSPFSWFPNIPPGISFSCRSWPSWSFKIIFSRFMVKCVQSFQDAQDGKETYNKCLVSTALKTLIVFSFFIK